VPFAKILAGSRPKISALIPVPLQIGPGAGDATGQLMGLVEDSDAEVAKAAAAALKKIQSK
jgi:hypothetical protein